MQPSLNICSIKIDNLRSFAEKQDASMVNKKDLDRVR